MDMSMDITMENVDFLSEREIKTEISVADDIRTAEGCGAFGWKPAWLQVFSSVKSFTLCLSVVEMINVLCSAYYTSVLTQIVRRFGLSTSMTSFLKNADKTSYFLTIIFVSHFFRSSNKPRLFAISCIASSFAIFLFILPHIIFGSGIVRSPEKSILMNSTLKQVSRESQKYIHLCVDGKLNMTYDKSKGCKDSPYLVFPNNQVAEAIFTFATILQGIARGPTLVLGITYMDDNSEGNSPHLLGFLFALRSIGPVIGFLMGTWTNSIYVDLSEPGFGPHDPRWVGAWWIGFAVCSALMLLSSVPMVLFPPELRQSYIRSYTGGLDMWSKCKDLPQALLQLARNPLYVTIILAACIDNYMAGYLTFLPQYFEEHFGQAASFASIIGGIAAFVWSLGPIISGKYLCKPIIPTHTMMKFLLLLSILSVTVFGVLIFLGCPEQRWMSSIVNKNLRETILQRYFHIKEHTFFNMIVYVLSLAARAGCNIHWGESHKPHDGFWRPDPGLGVDGDCWCPGGVSQPVCGADGVSYLTPCHAGCKQATFLDVSTPSKHVFSQCSRVSGITLTASEGRCGVECGHIVFLYAALFLITGFIFSMCVIPIFTIVMSCVSHKDKALSLALLTGMLQFSLIPAPTLFGYVIDSTCEQRDTSCGQIGACVIYNMKQFRLGFHGLALGFKMVAIFLFGACLLMSSRMKD